MALARVFSAVFKTDSFRPISFDRKTDVSIIEIIERCVVPIHNRIYCTIFILLFAVLVRVCAFRFGVLKLPA